MHVIVRKNQMTKETLPIPPGGMKCGRCVTHLLSLLITITISENEIKTCLKPHKTGLNTYTTLWSEGERRRGENWVFFVSRETQNLNFEQRFLLFFFVPAKNQQDKLLECDGMNK